MIADIDINKDVRASDITEAEVKVSNENTHKTVIICGLCGAREQSIGHNKTECPNCDEYIY
jgi:hypothetical protein